MSQKLAVNIYNSPIIPLHEALQKRNLQYSMEHT